MTQLVFDAPMPRLSGVVVAALLNDPAELASLGDALNQPPYKAPPRAPVLAVAPRNSLSGQGAPVRVPVDTPLDAPQVQTGAALGIVIGRTACRVSVQDALAHVAGYLLVNHFELPDDSPQRHYRPGVRRKARDGFCVLGTPVPAAQVPTPDALAVQVWVGGVLAQHTSTAGRVRGVAQLLADVSAFMTLHPGDVLTLGVAAAAPRARPGQTVVVTMEGLGSLSNPVVLEEPASAQSTSAAPSSAFFAPSPVLQPSRRSARVAYAGGIHTAYPHPSGLQLADGRVLAQSVVDVAVTWLPPFEVGTVIALGLNYADHVKELSKELTLNAGGVKDEPLVFLKSANACIGHQGQTWRPAEAAFMHYECELAVVIGRSARHVQAADAMQYVAGYTVCNDYAVRDYLENWYRPNLRVKHRDGATVLGPWLVPAAEVPNPHALRLRTLVNGEVKQQGSTAHMVNSVAELIEYLSSFMTLQAGDVILTGTPEGVANVLAGDEVITEIEGIGALANTLVGDAALGR
jgi:5-oxopent-3-ene-1,2,5-tricarboxylate decarboxylase/2-hydroxyhepta-2,4-diene-1,7-dioate isomerase